MRDYAFEIDENQRVPMRDGVTLSARIWRPVGHPGPLPAVIEAIPYRKSDATVERDATTHGVMVRAGYVCIRIDLRGSGGSGGIFDDEYSPQELDDIEDVIAWAVSAPWSSGAVGLMGISWGGINALLTAARRPKGLRAVIAAAAVIDRFSDDIHAKGGCELTSNFGWATQAMSVLSLPPDPATVDGDWLAVWRERLEQTVFLPSVWNVTQGKTPYWARTALTGNDIDIPVLALAGHCDGYRNLPMSLLGIAGPDSKAILGPWDHNYPNISSFGPWLDFPDIALRWWDRWLKDLPNGADLDPALSVFVMDGTPPEAGVSLPGSWLSLPDWPSADMAMIDYALTSHGLAQDDGPLSAVVEPDLTCGTAAGDFFSRLGAAEHQPGDQQEDDRAAFCLETAPLATETVLLGAARLDLVLSSDTRQGQIVARLCDVGPDGSSRLISLGVLNLACRAGCDRPEPMVPGRRTRVSLRFDDTGYRVAEGHVLRLALSGSYWPFIWPEPALTRLVLHGGHLTLPVYTGAPGAQIDDLDAPPPLPGVTRSLQPPALRQRWFWRGGCHIRQRAQDTGKIEILHNGLTRSGSMSETMSIDPGDPGSARMEVTRRSVVAWDGATTETVLSASMQADTGAFRLSGRLDAFHDGALIFSRVFEDRISRSIDRADATGGPNSPPGKVENDEQAS